MRVIYEPEAVEEVRQASAWYLVEAGERIASEFLQEIESKCALLVEYPKMGTPGGDQMRSMPLRVFPYTLHYKVETDAIRIFAFAHSPRELAGLKKSIYSLIDLREILLGCNQRYLAFLASLDDSSAGQRALECRLEVRLIRKSRSAKNLATQ